MLVAWFSSGGHKCDAWHPDGPQIGSSASEAQEEALVQIWKQIEIFVDEKGPKGVPRVCEPDWVNKIDELSIFPTSLY